jgi:energy-coupling factor transporter transmembrane protein EcfT
MRLDPRTKLLILAVTSVSVFMNKSIAVECVLAGIPLVLLSVSGNLKRMLKYAALFLALLLIQLFLGQIDRFSEALEMDDLTFPQESNDYLKYATPLSKIF